MLLLSSSVKAICGANKISRKYYLLQMSRTKAKSDFMSSVPFSANNSFVIAEAVHR